MAAESFSEEKIRNLIDQIMNLTLEEQRMLLSYLRDPDIGVREPRRPFRPSSSGAVVIEHDPESVTWDWRLG